jgi:hypothetical protein
MCNPGDTLLVDSWFGSVKAAIAVAVLGVHLMAVVKTGHAGFPKVELQTLMADMPGGVWAVLKSDPANTGGVPLLVIGYKYNTKKVLFFITTVGAGSTAPGKPYIAAFPESYGNQCTRRVARPVIITTCFDNSPKVREIPPHLDFKLKPLLSCESTYVNCSV